MEEYKEQYPNIESYAQCQSTAFVSGIVALILGGGGTYVGQELLHKSMPWTRKAFIFPAIIVGTIVSYKVTRRKTTACQEMWMALEEKQTFLRRLEREGLDTKAFDRKKAFDATRDVRIIDNEEDDDEEDVVEEDGVEGSTLNEQQDEE